MNNEHQIIARKFMPLIITLSEMYKQELYDDDLEIMGSILSIVKEFKKRKNRFYNDDCLIDDEDKECDYIQYLERELTNLLLIVYHVHKSEFDDFVHSSIALETDDIITSIMASNPLNETLTSE